MNVITKRAFASVCMASVLFTASLSRVFADDESPALTQEQLGVLVNMGLLDAKSIKGKVSKEDETVLALILEYNETPDFPEFPEKLLAALKKLKNAELRRRVLLLFQDILP